MLNIPPTNSDGVRRAIGQLTSEEISRMAVDAQLPFAIVQSPQEWLDNAQGKLMMGSHPSAVKKIGDAPIKPFVGYGSQPLSGVKVLMCTHAIAEPSAGRVLAEYGADRLQVFRPRVGFEHEFIYNEANTGCRSTQLDLGDESDL